jgi:enediyne biosynthesis protein E4
MTRTCKIYSVAPRLLRYTALIGVCFATILAMGLFEFLVRAAPKRPHFTDIASRLHLIYTSNNDYKLGERKFFPQPMCGGVAALDYDHDGLMDLYFTNGAKLPELKKTGPEYYGFLLRNKGNGDFEDVTAKAGLSGAQMDFSFGVAAADYDNDGYPDLFVANAGRNTLYHNNHDGTFTDVTVGSGLDNKPKDLLSVQAAWFDYDRDGLLDLIVSNYTYWSPAHDQLCMQAGAPIYCHPKTYSSVAQRLYHSLGNGKFEDVTEKAGLAAALGKGMGISIADFDHDGWLDIFVANDTERNFLFTNMKNGTFKEEGLADGVAYNDEGSTVSAMGADARDYDNDGWIDIFYNDLKGQTWGLFHNEHGRTFRYASPSTGVSVLSNKYSGWSNGFIDYNNDGWKDLYSSNGDVDNTMPDARQHDTMFENVDGRRFMDVSDEMGADFLHSGFQRGSSIIDLNNDGAMDLVVTSLNEPPRILMNSGDTGNHWLLIDAYGHKSPRDPVGAEFKLTTASGRVLYNHYSVSVGFVSTSDRRVHFGLGADDKITSLEIKWPSGIVQKLTQVKADQILRVEEPH